MIPLSRCLWTGPNPSPTKRTLVTCIGLYGRYKEQHVNRLEKFKADMLALHSEMEAETKAINEALAEMRAEDTETAIELTDEFLTVGDAGILAHACLNKVHYP